MSRRGCARCPGMRAKSSLPASAHLGSPDRANSAAPTTELPKCLAPFFDQYPLWLPTGVNPEDDQFTAFFPSTDRMDLAKWYLADIPRLQGDVFFAFLPESDAPVDDVGKLLARMPVALEFGVGRNHDAADDHLGVTHTLERGAHEIFEEQGRRR